MSTLTTRIGGYRYVIRSAVRSDFIRPGMVSIHLSGPARPSSEELWAKHGTTAVIGRFFADDTDDIMALPYELRTTSMQYQGETIGLLCSAEYAVTSLSERCEDVASRHSFDARPCDCEPCVIAEAIYARVYMAERKSLI